jgi:hypothetical protein
MVVMGHWVAAQSASRAVEAEQARLARTQTQMGLKVVVTVAMALRVSLRERPSSTAAVAVAALMARPHLMVNLLFPAVNLELEGKAVEEQPRPKVGRVVAHQVSETMEILALPTPEAAVAELQIGSLEGLVVRASSSSVTQSPLRFPLLRLRFHRATISRKLSMKKSAMSQLCSSEGLTGCLSPASRSPLPLRLVTDQLARQRTRRMQMVGRVLRGSSAKSLERTPSRPL